MQCERAQEFFSDYLERTLDRPMSVALETHIESCAGCREEIESLQEMFVTLDRVPRVQTPADGPWRVMARIRSERAEQWEAQRAQPRGFWQSLWPSLRTMNPASVGMTAGLATLLVAGGLLVPTVLNHTTLGVGHIGRVEAPPPRVEATYHPETRQVDLVVASPVDVPNARVAFEAEGKTVSFSDSFGLGPQHPFRQPFVFQDTTQEAQSIWISVTSPTRNVSYRYLAVIPLQQRDGERVTLLVENRPEEEALRQLAPYLGRPVVVSGNADAVVSLNAAGEPAERCLNEVARQSHAQVNSEAGAFHLAALP